MTAGMQKQPPACKVVLAAIDGKLLVEPGFIYVGSTYV